MVNYYFPDRGDIVWLQFNPQARKRSALVLSPKEYNEKTGLALICPVTSKIKGYPFEVRIPEGLFIDGAILVDQIKSLDWLSLSVQFICKIPAEIMQEVMLKLEVLIRD